jgi:hypothetical protein
VRAINKLLFSLLAFVLICGLVGCRTATDVLKIRLECAELCEQMDKSPFKEKVINDGHEIKAFMEAIKQAQPIMGKLDYGADFRMYVSFSDGSEKQYVLNIADDEKSAGLLVDMADSEQGYTIPKENAKVLSAIIYDN